MSEVALANQKLKQILTNPPSRSEEDWRYTDFRFLQKNSYTVYTPDVENSVDVLEKEKRLIIWLRSALVPFKADLSLPRGVSLKSNPTNNSHAVKNYFSQLGEELTSMNHQLVFDKHWNPDWTVEIVWHPRETMTSHALFAQKNLQIYVKGGAQVYLLEKSFLNHKQFVNINADYFLETGSQLFMLKSEKGQIEGRGCQTSRFSLAAKAHLQMTTFTLGSEWSRHNVYVDLNGEDAQTQVMAASILQNKEYVDHHTWIDHKVGDTSSSQRYINVLMDESHAVFNGKVHIHLDAQKSSAEQSNKNLLSSDKAHVDTKPELLIEADDVKAKHGATVGQLNADELFYLVSRGIDQKTAQQMLMRGFLNDIGDRAVDRFKDFFYQEIASYEF